METNFFNSFFAPKRAVYNGGAPKPAPEGPQAAPGQKPEADLSTDAGRKKVLDSLTQEINKKVESPQQKVQLLKMVDAARKGTGQAAIDNSIHLMAALGHATRNETLLNQAYEKAAAYGSNVLVERHMQRELSDPTREIQKAPGRLALYATIEAQLRKMPDSEFKNSIKRDLEYARAAEGNSEYEAIAAAAQLDVTAGGPNNRYIKEAAQKRIIALRDEAVRRVFTQFNQGQMRADIDAGISHSFNALGKTFIVYKEGGAYRYRPSTIVAEGKAA